MSASMIYDPYTGETGYTKARIDNFVGSLSLDWAEDGTLYAILQPDGETVATPLPLGSAPRPAMPKQPQIVALAKTMAADQDTVQARAVRLAAEGQRAGVTAPVITDVTAASWFRPPWRDGAKVPERGDWLVVARYPLRESAWSSVKGEKHPQATLYNHRAMIVWRARSKAQAMSERKRAWGCEGLSSQGIIHDVMHVSEVTITDT